MFKIDLNNWPIFLELINEWPRPWDANPEAWENYDHGDGIFIFNGTRDELKDVFYPIITSAQSYFARELCKELEPSERKEYLIGYGETEDFALFLDTMEE